VNLQFENISKSYNGKFVFEDLSGAIHNGDKIGLVGANGAGKTTLVRILMGLENCDSGNVRTFSPDAGILYIEQYPVYSEGQTVYQELKQNGTEKRLS